ncbi:RNase H family protein [Paracoccus binzhouensis]|uniref:RNase H family protein n=1 Tax=Paracoccus binzhouensis TaxID=2796149 RepID=UPI0022B8FA8F|nr:RNase H family protein [Paracoccus binzhouensis]
MSGEPGPGGWATIIQREASGTITKEVEVSGYAPATTNNQMELTAALRALNCLKVDEAAPITVRTDSEYLTKGMTEWLSN